MSVHVVISVVCCGCTSTVLGGFILFIYAYNSELLGWYEGNNITPSIRDVTPGDMYNFTVAPFINMVYL